MKVLEIILLLQKAEYKELHGTHSKRRRILRNLSTNGEIAEAMIIINFSHVTSTGGIKDGCTSEQLFPQSTRKKKSESPSCSNACYRIVHSL